MSSHILAATSTFNDVSNLLNNFKAEIVDEQAKADARNQHDTAQCEIDIAAAVEKVASRQHDVDSIKEHITHLENEKAEAEKDKKHREERIEANKELLAKFKQQRCDNNLIFVKQLREHMEGIDILTLLRQDIKQYFSAKIPSPILEAPAQEENANADILPHIEEIRNPETIEYHVEEVDHTREGREMARHAGEEHHEEGEHHHEEGEHHEEEHHEEEHHHHEEGEHHEEEHHHHEEGEHHEEEHHHEEEPQRVPLIHYETVELPERERVPTIERIDIENAPEEGEHLADAASVTEFIQRFQEFTHLLSDKHKKTFTTLIQTVQEAYGRDAEVYGDNADRSSETDRLSGNVVAHHHDARTEADIGTGHVDNDRGELQRLATPDYIKNIDYYIALEKKIYAMIDSLIQHLEASREELTRQEIKAAQDFAVFHSNMEKENEHLLEKIAELTRQITDLENQLNVAKEQLGRREQLLEQAKEEEREIRRICKEKADYYERETNRRNGEISTVDSATDIFNSVLGRIQRSRERTEAHQAGGEFGNELSKHVKRDEAGMHAGVETNKGERYGVVF